MKKPFLLGETYFPSEQDNRMSDEGDVRKAREDFLKHKPSNLSYLLEKRFAWMNGFIKEEESGVDVGCGTGLSKLFISSSNFTLTDFCDNEWVERKVDVLAMPFPNSSLDYIVSSNMIHHLARPTLFFEECSRVLKIGGKLIIQEINGSLLMRLLLRLMRHEGYSYDVDVFDKERICNDPSDPWSANCVIPNLLFDDMNKFLAAFPCFQLIHHRYTECLIFPLSGGVIAKRKTVNLPLKVLRFIDAMDDVLIHASTAVFPLQRQVVFENRKTPENPS